MSSKRSIIRSWGDRRKVITCCGKCLGGAEDHTVLATVIKEIGDPGAGRYLSKINELKELVHHTDLNASEYQHEEPEMTPNVLKKTLHKGVAQL
jgi:hypothetical protein